VLKHLHYLWPFDVKIVQEVKDGSDKVIAQCPDKKRGITFFVIDREKK